jgi:hypothetical protein
MNRSTDGKTTIWRLVLALVAGIVAWTVVASLLNLGLRFALPGYAAAEPDKAFTLMMEVARLVMGALASLAGGAAAGWIDRPAGPSVWILAIVLLVAFIPMHVGLWPLFPVWYHLTFLVSLAPLTLLGSLIGHKRALQGQEGNAQQA